MMEPWNPVGRGILVTTLILLIGVPPTLSFVIFPELERHNLSTARAHRTALSVIGALLIGAGLTGTVLTGGNGQWSNIGSFITWIGSTPTGQAWTVFIVATAVAGAVTTGRHVLPDVVSRRFWLSTVLVGALAMLIGFCWTRYSTAVGTPTIAILVKVVHMGGGALWVGGLTVLAALPTLMPRDPDGDQTEFVLSTVRRFSIIAVTGVTVAFATGSIIVAWHVPTLTALATTPYGILLSVKVGLVLVAAAMGGFNRVILHEQIASSVRKSADTAVLPGMLTAVSPRITAADAVATVTRSVRLELAVLALATALSVALTTAVTPSYELLKPAVVASSELVRGVEFTKFTTLLKYGAIGVGLLGSLAVGYEAGQFDVGREPPASQPPQQPPDEAGPSRE